MPSKKEVSKKAVTKRPPARTAKKVATKKAPAAAAAAVTEKPGPQTRELSVQPRTLLDKKAGEKGETIEDLVAQRKVDLLSVDDYLGITEKQDYRNRPEIPGVFDLLIPPGTPRKLVIKIAKEYPVQIVRRDDVYVPVGVSDVERDLLAIRGDEATVKKMEVVLKKEIESYIDHQDARLHDYSKPVKLEGIGPEKKKPRKTKA